MDIEAKKPIGAKSGNYPFITFSSISAAGLGILLLLFLWLYLYFPETAIWLTKEDGVIESMQASLYLVCAAVSFLYAAKKIWSGGWSGGLVLLIMTMRELDFHRRFTGHSFTMTNFYFSSRLSIPLSAKIFYGIIVLAVLCFLVWFLIKNVPIFMSNLKARKRWTFPVVIGAALVIVSNFLDTGSTYLKSAGIVVRDDIDTLKNIYEEVIELAIPPLFLMALIRYGRYNRRGNGPPIRNTMKNEQAGR